MTSKTTSNSPTPGETTGADVAPVTPEIPAVVNASEPVVAPVPAATKPHTAPAATPPPTPAVSVPEALFTQADWIASWRNACNASAPSLPASMICRPKCKTSPASCKRRKPRPRRPATGPRKRSGSAKIVTAAAALGFADPADAVRLLDATSSPRPSRSELKGLATQEALPGPAPSPAGRPGQSGPLHGAGPPHRSRTPGASYLGRTPGAFWAGGGYTLSPKGLEE